MNKTSAYLFFYLLYIHSMPLLCQSISEQLEEIEKIEKLGVKSLTVLRYNYSFEGNLSSKAYKETDVQYDKEGKKIEKNKYYADTRVAYKTKYVYDEDYIEVRRYWENASGGKFKMLHHYDERGFLKESIGYNEQRSVNSRRSYEYDNNGKLIKRIIKYLSNTYTYHYKYNNEGKLLEEFAELPNSGRGNELTLYKYNDEGLILEAKIYDNIGDPVAFLKYEYRYY